MSESGKRLLRSSYSHLDWSGLIREYEVSNQSIADFCSEKGISASTFYKYRSRSRVSEPKTWSGSSGFIELGSNDLLESSSVIEIETSRGFTLKVPADRRVLSLVLEIL